MEDLFTSLPEDIWIDIASRLSGKDACKSKSLSKSWLSLISSNSDFKKLHRLRALQRPPLLVLICDNCILNRPTVSNVDFADEKLGCSFRRVCLHGSYFGVLEQCRDLICLYNSSGIFICNPSITQYLQFRAPRNSAMSVKFGLVYIASLKVYKVVLLTVTYPFNVKFEALTLHEDVDDCVVAEGNGDSWELISEHTLTDCRGIWGNVIGVNGVVYCIYLTPRWEKSVLSLNFEEDNKQQQFKMFSLPQVCDHRCRCTGYTLSQVNDVLCFPHISADCTTIDLWLLQDRNNSIWFKAYAISYIPPYDRFRPRLGRVVYLPQPTTIDNDHDGGGDNAGLFLFAFENDYYHYDMRTQEAGRILQGKYYKEELLVFFDNLVSLKKGLSMTPLYCKNNFHQGMYSLPQPPPPAPQPLYYHTNVHHSIRSHPPSPPQIPTPQHQSFLPQPPPSYYPHNLKQNMGSILTHPPSPQGSLQPPLHCHNSFHQGLHSFPQPPPPPLYYHNNLHKSLHSLRPPPPPPPPPPQIPAPQHQSFLPPRPPPYHPQNFQHQIYPPLSHGFLPKGVSNHPNNSSHDIHSPVFKTTMPHPQQPQGVLPPPPYYPHNLQHGIYVPELKRRKLSPPPYPCTLQSGTKPQLSLSQGSLPQPLKDYPQHIQHGVCSAAMTRRTTTSTLPLQHAAAEENNTSSTSSATTRPPLVVLADDTSGDL